MTILQLKEAEMQRREAEDKASHQQDTINSMQAELDKEDADLNEARLSLADSHLGSSARDTTSQAAGGEDRIHALAAEALNEAEPWSARRPAARSSASAKGVSPESVAGDQSSSRWRTGMRDTLDEQRRDDARLAQEEAQAHRRARAEESKLKAAQEEVARQLSKVTNLEGSMH